MIRIMSYCVQFALFQEKKCNKEFNFNVVAGSKQCFTLLTARRHPYYCHIIILRCADAQYTRYYYLLQM